MADRIDDGLKWLALEIGATKEEFRSEFGQEADALLDGLVSHGYVQTDGVMHQVGPAGWNRLHATDPA
jgi:hypothetical protein